MSDTTCLTTDFCGETEVVSGTDGDVVPVLEDDSDLDMEEDLNVVVTSRSAVYCIHSKPCAICTYLVITVLLLGSVVALLVVGVMVISPYRRVSHFISTDCHVTNATWSSSVRQCSCGKSCSSTYPCLIITVTVPQLNTNSSSSLLPDGNHSLVLHEDETLLDKKCSFYPRCRNSKVANEYAVIQYRRRYGITGSSYKCLYEPDDDPEVIRNRKFQQSFVINAVVWPIVTMILCVSLLAIAHKRRRTLSPL